MDAMATLAPWRPWRARRTPFHSTVSAPRVGGSPDPPPPPLFRSQRIAAALARIRQDPTTLRGVKPWWLEARGPLLEASSGKCAWCEQLMDARAATVDHFRPKQGALGLEGDAVRECYWWLIYTWSNLVPACRT